MRLRAIIRWSAASGLICALLVIRMQTPRESSTTLAQLASKYLEEGNYDAAIVTLRRAVRLNPGDAGVNGLGLRRRDLSNEAVRHGEQQVRRMLADRPNMSTYVHEGDPLWRWAVRKFAGEDLESFIEWDASLPSAGDASCMPANENSPARIRVRSFHVTGSNTGNDLTFEELWKNAAFELLNLNNSERFNALDEQVVQGLITKRDFILKNFEIEHRTTECTRAFYIEVFLPIAKTVKIRTNPLLWYTSSWGSAQDSIRAFNEDAEYPWGLYGYQYDAMRSFSLYEQGCYKEALRVLTSMLAATRDESERERLKFLIDQCRANSGNE